MVLSVAVVHSGSMILSNVGIHSQIMEFSTVLIHSKHMILSVFTVHSNPSGTHANEDSFPQLGTLCQLDSFWRADTL